MRRLRFWNRFLMTLLGALLVAACGAVMPPGIPDGGEPASLLTDDLPPTPTPDGDLLDVVLRRGVLRISSDANYPPQSFLKMDGSWQGFDIEVGREVARRLGVRAEFLDIAFDRITAGGWGGRWDANVGSMTITPERAAALRFTTPYYYTPAAFAVHADSPIQEVAQLEGHTVGVAVATTYADYLSGTLRLDDGQAVAPPPRVQAQTYATEALALQDLGAGSGERLDAVLMALPTIHSAAAEGAPVRVVGEPVYYEALAIALDRSGPRDSERLAEAISAAIESMRADGTLARLSQEFYGVDISTPPRP